MNRIFIQIASYRDPELNNTLEDLIKNSKYPENLRFGIAHQRADEDEWDTLDKYKDDSRFKIIDIPYKKSKGACWARNKIQQLYDGEEYTLQLDSHHRFEKNWDEISINLIKELQEDGYSKPLLTAYLPSFTPGAKNNEEKVKVPWGMSFDRFTPEGVVFFLPYYMEPPPEKPLKTRYFSAHFCFTLGSFATEVQHDPEMYFHGEEISLAVRAYTHGYDLFHPNKLIAWHEYTRKGRTKHWDDHNDWVQVNTNSHQRMRNLLNMEGECTPCIKKSLGKYYLGTTRTLEDYQSYAGINFRTRNVQQETLDNTEPPNTPDKEFLSRFKHFLDINPKWFTEKDEYLGLGIFFEKNDGTLIYRKDLDKPTFNSLLKRDHIAYPVEFLGEQPDKWIVWAFSEDGWHERYEFSLEV
tara:strand:+ start:7286 stop:8515 length:1230 start_codon:yes stop_codon:yes gene_type:complete